MVTRQETATIRTALHELTNAQQINLAEGMQRFLPTAQQKAKELWSEAPPKVHELMLHLVAYPQHVLAETLAALSTVKRWDGRQSFDNFTETNYEHVLGMYNIARHDLELAPDAFSDVQWAEIFLLVFLHDLPEVICNDMSHGHPAYVQANNHRHFREHAGLRFLLEKHRASLSLEFIRYVQDLYQRYEERDDTPLTLDNVHFLYLKLIDMSQGDYEATRHFDDLAKLKERFGPIHAAFHERKHGRKKVQPRIASINALVDRMTTVMGTSTLELILAHRDKTFTQYRDAGYAV